MSSQVDAHATTDVRIHVAEGDADALIGGHHVAVTGHKSGSPLARDAVFHLMGFGLGAGRRNHGAMVEFVALVVGLRVELGILHNGVAPGGDGGHGKRSVRPRTMMDVS
ncbi:MAG: hypothetical protein ABEL97_04625 [Salinibacter sp.]